MSIAVKLEVLRSLSQFFTTIIFRSFLRALEWSKGKDVFKLLSIDETSKISVPTGFIKLSSSLNAKIFDTCSGFSDLQLLKKDFLLLDESNITLSPVRTALILCVPISDSWGHISDVGRISLSCLRAKSVLLNKFVRSSGLFKYVILWSWTVKLNIFSVTVLVLEVRVSLDSG